MAELSKKHDNKMNPWILHLQKLGLELKCPLCLKLPSRPCLLPCNHMFCDSCIYRPTDTVSECPLCNSGFENRDIRIIPVLENVVAIYKSLDAAFSAGLSYELFVRDGDAKDGLVRKRNTQGRELNDGKSLLSLLVDVQPLDPYSLELLPSSTMGGNLRHKRLINLQNGGTQGEQLSTDSIFSIAKGSDNDSRAMDNHHIQETQSVNGKRNAEGSSTKDSDSERDADSEQDADNTHMRNFKRLKKSSPEPIGKSAADHKWRADPVAEVSVFSNFDSKQKSVAVCHSLQPFSMVNVTSGKKASCRFCQSSEVSEVTGEMLYYSNGRLVDGHDVFRSDVIHVHRSCIDWAPQVYYEGDMVKNLNAEITRGSKIKCAKCGVKGAALGCFVRSCPRSYHVPCAKQIPRCRWDYEGYLMLCPTHSYVKFPAEKCSRALKDHNSSLQIKPNEIAAPADKPTRANQLVLCGSALSPEEKFCMVRFAEKIGATVVKFWSDNVTHVIAATNHNGAYTRTLKVLMGILNGKWILRTDWVRASMLAMEPVEEEPYEINIDNHGCCNGPKTGRQRARDSSPKLFEGLKFYLLGGFVQGYMKDLKNLIKVGGGLILSSEELMVQGFKDEAGNSRTVVVFNMDPTRGYAGEEIYSILERQREAEKIASAVGAWVVGHVWILESIAAYKLQQPLLG